MLEALRILVSYALSLGLIYTTSLITYRIYFHPLAAIPGPPLARITYLFEWYYDLFLGGQFTSRLAALHQEYGPVIRINPDEVHINDPDYFDEVYNQANGRNVKPPNVAGAFGPYSGTIATASHELHRIRRSALNPFFSKRSVQNLLPVMQRPIKILCDRLCTASDKGLTVNLKYIYAAVTLDIINDYCFARDPVYILKPDFGGRGFEKIDNFLKMSLLNIHIPWAIRLTYSLPERLKRILAPDMADTLDFRLGLSRQVEAIRSGQDKAYEHADHRTVFHELFSSKLPPEELTPDRMRDEAFTLVNAGSGTVATVLRGTAYHVAANESIRQKLHDELCAAIPDPTEPLSLMALEQLPYLSAVVNEGLRLCSPVTHRISRQFPDRNFTYNGYIIPPGSTVSLTLQLLMTDAAIFPEPHAFRPERWLSEGRRLEKYLVPFNRGPRMCVGYNLARAELVLILAAVFLQFTFDVSAVIRERDVDLSRDYILGATAQDSPGILVRVRKC
ncbi:hypothetical protein BDV12DRAFT_176445 [Aspergillus spectabilis]